MYRPLVSLSLLLVVLSANAADIRTPLYESRPKFYLEDGRIRGLCVDVLKAIERIVPDLRFVTEFGIPLRRVEAGVANGTYGLLLCATPTPERDEKMRRIGVPIYSVRDLLVVRTDDPLTDATLEDIRKMPAANTTILTYDGSGQQTWLQSQPGLKLDHAPTAELMLQMLLAHRGRFAFISESVLSNLVKKSAFSGRIKILHTPVRDTGRYLFFARNVPDDTLARIESALLLLAKRGELKEIATLYSVTCTNKSCM